VSSRVLIVDDNESFLDAARTLLEREELSVVGVASTIATALARATELAPDVILVDINLAQESGFELAARLSEGDCAAAVILISTHAEADLADLIAASPALGFLPKSDLSAESIREVLEGGGRGQC
jgi:two-component system, NarL family, nitrate/nitrite response regulator NarL